MSLLNPKRGLILAWVTSVAGSPQFEQSCLPMTHNPQDCVAEGSFVCAATWPQFPPDPHSGQGRFGYCHKPGTGGVGHPGGLVGSFDEIALDIDGSAVVTGWAVDWGSQNGTGHGTVLVKVTVDGAVIWQAAADASRPSLVQHGVAPDPNHGLATSIPRKAAAAHGISIGSVGNRTVRLQATSTETGAVTLLGRPHCVTDGRVDVYCGGPPEPEPWYCCRQPPNTAPAEPAPPRIAARYPLPPHKRPAMGNASVVFVLTDDQDLMLGSLDAMNTTKELFLRGGAKFDNFFVTTPICCPSRVSILSGRWAHNTGAVATTPAGWCAVNKYWKAPMQTKSLPNYMQAAGLATGLFGKELNVNDDTFISPGWDRFFALGGPDEGHFYGNWFNDGGVRYNASEGTYMTELIQERAIGFIQEQIAADRQFFAYVAPHAPHTRATPAPGTEGYFFNWTAPRLPSWNRTLPNHHWLVRTQPPMTQLCAGYSDSLYRNRLRSLLGVDALVAAIADTLLAAGRLDSTYMMYSADHGFHLGEMSMPFFKGQPYDTDLRVPFMIRGPGIAPGSSVSAIALNVDIAPTIAGLVRAAPFPESLTDGHSLTPLLFAPNTSQTWRQAFVFEFWAGGKAGEQPKEGAYCSHNIMSVNNTYQGVRTASDLKLVDFRPHEDFEEAFNLTADPYEMVNLASDPASQPWVEQLRERLRLLRNCTQASCWDPLA